jgi:hypothetical protein
MSGTGHDTFDIAGQEANREKAAREAAQRARIEVDDLKWVMQNKRGRRFVHSVLERAGVFRSTFHTNALTMAFSEGARNEGLKLTNRLIEHSPELWQQMLAEQKEPTNE